MKINLARFIDNSLIQAGDTALEMGYIPQTKSWDGIEVAYDKNYQARRILFTMVNEKVVKAEIG